MTERHDSQQSFGFQGLQISEQNFASAGSTSSKVVDFSVNGVDHGGVLLAVTPSTGSGVAYSLGFLGGS
jgi:hypothetical protein